MRLAHALRRFVVLVQSPALERRLPQLAVDVEPEAGARWGRPARFDQALRDRMGKPLIVRSGYRSPEHNRAVGGAKHSKHMEGIRSR